MSDLANVLNRPPVGTLACGYCGQPTEFHATSEAWYGGIDRGPIWACLRCAAWTGCHPGTWNPLGSVAKKSLRRLRQRAHLAFDPIWKSGAMKRKRAYAWLSDETGIEAKRTHISMMDENECHLAEGVCLRAREEGHFEPLLPADLEASWVDVTDRRANIEQIAREKAPDPACLTCLGAGQEFSWSGPDGAGGRRQWRIALRCRFCGDK